MGSDNMLRYALATGMAVALSLVVVLQPGKAAAQRYGGEPGARYGGTRGLYNYVPYAPEGGEAYQSRNGTPFGPPDPATCGGYQC